ncbi:hypothetical protein N0V93_001702 [Gnomoniopsis smithogilvyi]|uniref:2EXR domain-containing protein n=1 Tax=Gnomoniopsis smithogilvyi TaxID=1191159 RepID=A0A9W9D1X5_9PEZI|nr:hypothetical protein N0V93_001702 [Gnomoniopsis smithogilvyi]
MGSQPSVRILNIDMMGTPGHEVFHLFPTLPKELRLQIWETAVPRERLIHISLKLHQGRRYELATAEPRYLERNALRKPISGERYRAVAEGQQLNSKFLRVNSEARCVALAFYRVHIPVYLSGPKLTERTTLFFNPENDFLHIKAEAPIRETLIDFLWDLKAYDPKDIGLLKLAIDLEGFCANDLEHLRRSDLFLIRQRKALVDTLSQLKEVWFLNLQSPRWVHKQPVEPIVTQIRPSGVFPVAGGSPTLERVGADPRHGLEQALERVYMGDIDPREILFRWRRLLRTWEIDYEDGQVDYRVLFAVTPERHRRTWRIKQLDQAMEFLTLEEEPIGPVLPAQSQIGQAHRCMAAIGFWLFPVESIGQIREGEKLADMDFYPGRVLDMREHWPELICSKLSGL